MYEDDKMQICEFYLKGQCKYGKDCKNFHPIESDEVSDKVNFAGDQECAICINMILAKDR